MEESNYDKDILTDAKLSSGAYGGKDVAGFTIDKELSSPDRTAYVDPEGNLTLAFRGTDLKNKNNRWRDLGTDALIGLGLQDYSSRFKNAKKATEKAKEKYGAGKVTVTGHSMGGSTSAHVSRATGVKGTAFDPAFSPVDAFLRKRTYSNTKAFRFTNDLVSGLAPNVRRLSTTTINKKTKNPHALTNFLSYYK